MSFLLAYRKNHLKKGPDWTTRSDFVKLGSKILYLFLAEKYCLFCFVCCNTLSDFGLLFINCSSRRAEKDAVMYPNSRMFVFEQWGYLDLNFD